MSKADDDNLDPFDFDLPDDDLAASGEEPDAADAAGLESLDDLDSLEDPGSGESFGDLEESGASDDAAKETVSKPGKKKKKKEKKPRAKKQKKEKKPRAKKPKQESEEESGPVGSLVWAVCGVSCLVLLIVNGWILVSRGTPSIAFIIILTVIWLTGTVIPFLLWKGRQTNTAYVVFLSLSLAGILVANLFLLLELASYGGDFGAKGAQQSMHVAPAVQSAPANTIATA